MNNSTAYKNILPMIKDMEYREEDTRHYKLAMTRLRRISKLAKKRGFSVKKDLSFPYHIILIAGSYKYSVYCGGFDSNFDIQLLTNDGKPDYRFKERRYFRIDHLLKFIAFRVGEENLAGNEKIIKITFKQWLRNKYCRGCQVFSPCEKCWLWDCDRWLPLVNEWQKEICND